MSIKTAINIMHEYAIVLHAATPKKRGLVCVEAEHPSNKSKIDRFVINKPSEARKALQRANALTKPPKWWVASVDDLKAIITKKVNEHYVVENKEGKISVKKKE